MTLTRLSLHNYMIHRDLTADFSGNLIALTGEMGHGKSTFVGAIQFCLTGEHPPWHRDDLLSWGQDEGSAKLYFTQDGLDCSILRKLHCPDVVLRIGEETVTGARNVEKALYERLGVDRDILRQIGFVQQCEIQAILFDDPGKRERAFQKLLGIGEASKIWTELGPLIQSYARSENFDASIETLRQSIARLEEGLASVDASIAQSEEALGLVPSREDLRADVDRMTRVRSAVESLESVRASLYARNRAMAENERRLSDLSAKRKAILDGMRCSLPEMEAFVETLKSEHASAAAALDNMRKLSAASESGDACPLCGSHVRPGQIPEHIREELKRLSEDEAARRKAYADARASYATIRNELDLLDKSVVDLSRAMATSVGMLDAEKAREKEFLAKFAELGISPDATVIGRLKSEADEKLAWAHKAASEYDDLSLRIATLRGERNARSQQVEHAKSDLEAKVREKALHEPVREKVEVLTNVRNWFHSSCGPRTMTMAAVRAMTGYVNEYLSALHSEIEVMPDNNGLSFSYSYLDGRPVSDPPPSTSKLSGGQKIELALAFRLAIYRYFGQKMGIMVLDEPTAHLSPSGVEHFGTLLQTVSALARNMNLQIVMPTHEKEILPYMDSEIRFS